MTTDSKTQANQANAQHSTGPRTPEGKAISSRNAITHGLTALSALVPGEDPIVYESYCAGMLAAFDPYNTPETALVQEITDVQWRLRRASRCEAAILSTECPDMKALNNLGLYISRLKRQYSVSLKEFQQMHSNNMEDRRERLKDARNVHRADLICRRPSTVDQYGFEFTLEEMKHWNDTKTRLAKNREIVEDWGDEHDDSEYDDLEAAA